MGISMGLLGFSVYCQSVNYQFTGLRVIPLLSIVLYTLSYGSGNNIKNHTFVINSTLHPELWFR